MSETMRARICEMLPYGDGERSAIVTLAAAHDAMDARLAALERAEAERKAGGYWSCTGCAATPDASGAWRWEGDKWAHRCPGNPPQAGHEPARWFGRGAPTGPDGLPMTVDARGVPFIRPELAAKAAAWREAQPGDIIVPDPRIAELEARVAALTAEKAELCAHGLFAEREALLADVARLTAERDAAVRQADEAKQEVENVWARMKNVHFDLHDAEGLDDDENSAHVGASEE